MQARAVAALYSHRGGCCRKGCDCGLVMLEQTQNQRGAEMWRFSKSSGATAKKCFYGAGGKISRAGETRLLGKQGNPAAARSKVREALLALGDLPRLQ